MRIFVLWFTGRDLLKPKPKPVPVEQGFRFVGSPPTIWEFLPTGHEDVRINVYKAPNVFHRWLQWWCFGMVWRMSSAWVAEVKGGTVVQTD